MLATTSNIVEKKYRMNVFHDPFNKRIRIDDIQGDPHQAMGRAEKIANDHQVEKLIVKARLEQLPLFLENGYVWEGTIDNYFLGSACYFLCKYFSAERRNSPYWCKEDEILKEVQGLKSLKKEQDIPASYVLKKITEQDVNSLAELYRTVFEVYPTPLQEGEYIKKTLQEGTIYYAFFKDGVAVSAASAEVNATYKNAELTDCATLPEHRKFGLLKVLLKKLEQHLIEEGIYCSYSLARALSYGMNAALKQLGYSYRGRLANNCFIFDKIENMNVWVKDLSS